MDTWVTLSTDPELSILPTIWSNLALLGDIAGDIASLIGLM